MEFSSPRFVGDQTLWEILNDDDTGTKKLKKNSPVPAVLKVQTALFDLKWSLVGNPPVDDFAVFCDGDYGPATESTVLAYKRHYDIHFPPSAPTGSYDGYVGPRTLRRLDPQCVLWDESADAIFTKTQELHALGIAAEPDPRFPTPFPILGTPGVLQVMTIGGTDGRIYHRGDIGAFEVHGAIWISYSGFGDATGPLGFPTSDEYAEGPAFRRSDFEFGSLRYDVTTGGVELVDLNARPPMNF